jgi:hypothetical protein
MHTPEQAKELWCPMVRHTGGEGTFNRGITSGAETNSTGPDDDRFICNCISDKCAMWRWHPNSGEHMADKRKGYCGLAGRPGVA